MELRQGEDSTVLEIAGPVRLGEALELHALALSAADLGRNVTVELGGAEHLHAAALQVLRALEAHLIAQGRVFKVGQVSTAAATAIGLCGLGRWLPSEEEHL